MRRSKLLATDRYTRMLEEWNVKLGIYRTLRGEQTESITPYFVL